MIDCKKVRLPGGGTQNFDSKKKIQDFINENSDVYDFLRDTKKSEDLANKKSNFISETQEELIRSGENPMSQIHSKDRFFYNSGRDFQVVNLDKPGSWDAPTLQLNREGQDFINSNKFVQGTPVHFIYSEKTPYNQQYGFNNFKQLAERGDPTLLHTKLSAVVFVDKKDNPLPSETTQDKKVMTSLLESGEAKIKYVGSYHEFANLKDVTPTQQKIRDKAVRYKEKISKTSGIVTADDVIHYSPEVMEPVQFLAGFNKRINYKEVYTDSQGNVVTKDTPGAKKTVEQKFKNLSALPWFDKSVVPLLGIVGQESKEKDSQYVELNNTGVIRDKSLFKNLNNGDPYLFLPSNINTGNSYKENGQHYFPIRMIAKSWSDNPIFNARFAGIMKKIFRGKIDFDIKNVQGKNEIINVRDDSKLKFNNAKPFMQDKWVEKIWNNESYYSRFNVEYEIQAQDKGQEVSKEGLRNYLEERNPDFQGEVYASLFEEAPINFLQALQEFVGMQTILTNDLKNILDAAKKYRQQLIPLDKGDNADQLYEKFFNEDQTITTNTVGQGTTLSNKRSQISIAHFHNQKYLNNYIYRYGVLITDLAEDRPTGDLTFWTKEQTEEPEAIFDSRYSSQIDQETLSEDQALQWITSNFPNFPTEFHDNLIEDLYNGRFDRATNTVALAKDYISTGLLKEEFMHAIFAQQSKEDQDNLLKEVAELTGIVEDDIVNLEEALAKIVREDPRDLKEGFIQKFINYLKELLQSVFNTRSAIQTFSDRFHRGYFKNVKPTNISEGVRYSLSPEYSSVNNKRRKEAIDIINRNYLPEILKGKSLEEKLSFITITEKLKGNSDYSSADALGEVYKEVENLIKNYIKTYEKKKDEIHLRDSNRLVSILKMMQEPALQADLRADLKDSHGIKIRYEAQEAEVDKLNVVKDVEVDIVQKLGSKVRVLLYNIPDIIDIPGIIEPTVGTYIVKNGEKQVTLPSDVRQLLGVNYDKISDLFTYNQSLQHKVDLLLHGISGSSDISTMLSKLDRIAETGEPWLKVLQYKLSEEKILGKSELVKELWTGIGQLHFLEELKLYSQYDDFFIASSNTTDLEKALSVQMIQDGENFGLDIDGRRISKEALKKKVDWVLKQTGTATKPGTIDTKTFFDIVPKVFRELGFNINTEDLLKMRSGFREAKGKNLVGFKTTTLSNFIFTLGNLAQTLENNNYQYDFLRGDASRARADIKLLSQIIASAGNRQQLTSYLDVEKRQRQSYHNPNFLLRTFRSLFDNPTLIKEHYKKLFGMRYNPLMDLILANPRQFDLKKYGGNQTLNSIWENLNTTQRVIDLINIGQTKTQSGSIVGNFWVGNLSDSPTAYLLQAPLLGQNEIINKYFNLFQQELDYLFSKVRDKNFLKNRSQGFTLAGVNELVFGKSVLNAEDFNADTFNAARIKLLEKQGDIEVLIWKDMQARYQRFYNEHITSTGILEKKEKKIKQKAMLSNDGGQTYYEGYQEVTIEEESKVFKKHVDDAFIQKWFHNDDFYQTASLYFFIGHPYFGKDRGDISKRLKQIHTDGVINSVEGPAKFVMLKDRESSSNTSFLNAIENELPDIYKEISKEAFQRNKETDSAANGSLAFLRRTDPSWDEKKEALYQAEVELNFKKIQELGTTTDFQPTKLGVFTHEMVETGYMRGEDSYKIIVPTIQKYMMKWTLPSQVYRTKDGDLIRPDKLAEKQGMMVGQIYSQYQFPDLARQEFEFFKIHDKKGGIDYTYFASGAKFGEFGEHDLSSRTQPEVREIKAQDLKIVTEQPNKNNLGWKVTGSQGIFQMPGMIQDDAEYNLGGINIPGYNQKVSGIEIRKLFETALAMDIEEEKINIPFYVGGKVDLKNLSLFLLEEARNSNWSTSEMINGLDLNQTNENLKIRPYSNNSQITFLNSINSAVNKALRIKSRSPAFKNVAYDGGLNTKLIGTPENRGLEVECRLAKWPELIEYQRRKLESSGANLDDPKVWYESDQEIIGELNTIGFKFNAYRIPTEGPYSYIRLKIKDFSPNHAGNAIELSKEMTTQTGFDFDADALFTLISQLQYNGDNLMMIEPGLGSREQRQSLYARIYDEVLRKKGNDQRIPGEYNRLDLLAEQEKIPDLKPGTLEYNLYYQKLNDLASDAIGPKAVVLTVATFIQGHFPDKAINFKERYPVLDKDYGQSITNWTTETPEGDIPKLQLLAQGVSAAVNMPKNATLTKLKLNKELSAVLDVMTMKNASEAYSIAFLQQPVIQKYIKQKDILAVKYSGWEYNKALRELKEKLLGGTLFNMLNDASTLDLPISLESLQNGKADQDIVFAKYLVLKSRSEDFANLTINFQRLTKPQEPKPELVRNILFELQDLHNRFEGTEDLLPIFQYKNSEFSIKTKTGIPIIDQSADLLLTKILSMQSVSTYFHPKFMNSVNTLFKDYAVRLDDQGWLALNEYMRRMVKTKQVKPLSSLLHLGKRGIVIADGTYYYPGSLGYVRNYLQGLWNKSDDIAERGKLQSMMAVTSYLTYGEQEINYLEDGKLSKTRDLKLVSGFYQDRSFLESFETGFLEMIRNVDPILRQFAEDMRDYSLYKGWSRGNNNWAPIVPATVWENYEDQWDKDLASFGEQKFLEIAALNNPSQFLRPVSYRDLKNFYDSNSKLGKLNLNLGFVLPAEVKTDIKNLIGEARYPKMVTVKLKDKEKNKDVFHIYKHIGEGEYRKVPGMGFPGVNDFDTSGSPVIIQEGDTRQYLPVTLPVTPVSLNKSVEVVSDPDLLNESMKYNWARYSSNSYEVSSAGDKRFSAFNAILSTGKSIEDTYQNEIKASLGDVTGKGKYDPNVSVETYYEAYKKLWKQWAQENPQLIEELKSKSEGKILTDKFAKGPVSQARALAEILNEKANENIEFTQDQLDTINKNLPDGLTKYSLEDINNLPNERKQKALDYYKKCIE